MRKTYPNIPQHEMDALARRLLPYILKFYESEEGKQAFEAWRREQKAQAKH